MSTSLFRAYSFEWLLSGYDKSTGQKHCVKICTKEIKEEKIRFFLLSQCYLFVELFSFGEILDLLFFNQKINGYSPLIEIFLFSSYTYYYFFT